MGFGGGALTEDILNNNEGVLMEGFKWLGLQILNFLIMILDKILAVVALAIIGYVAYQAIRYMWFGKSELIQKSLFGYFGFLCIRILSTLININQG